MRTITRSIRKPVLSAAIAAALALAPVAPAMAKQAGPDWLWLSATATDCTFTVTVNWAGFQEAKLLEVFATDGYAGSALVPTTVAIKNKDATATVTLPPLAASATSSIFYPWAQLIDTHGNAIPASLDFSGATMLYCTAP